MANTIRNKYSEVTATPSSLADGELAYSKLSNSLFIGQNGDGTVVKVGGKADVDKLAGIEVGATADQTGAEIKALYELEANAFTDAQFTKLAGIEAGADVTDAANVDAAGAVMLTDTDASTMSFVIDEDNMASNSATKVPTQQSVKQYVDTEIAGLASGSAFQGEYNAATNTPDLDTSPSGITVGDYYVVSVAGTFFSTAVEVGDLLFAKQTNPTTEAHWAIANRNIDSSAFATAAQGALADSAVQPGDNVSDLTNDSGFIANVVEDTTPQLGGNLDLNGNSLVDGAATALSFSINPAHTQHFEINNAGATTDLVDAPYFSLGGTGNPNIQFRPATVDDYAYFHGNIALHGSGGIFSSDKSPLISFNASGSAVNNIEITSQVTGQAPAIEAVGSDTDVSLNLGAQGAGEVVMGSNLRAPTTYIPTALYLGTSNKLIQGRSTDIDVQTDIRIYNDGADGKLKLRNVQSANNTIIQHYASTNALESEYKADETNTKISITNPLGYTFEINGFVLTNTDGTDGMALTTDGAGNLAFETVTAVTEGAVTAHQAALSITESQISDLGTYLETVAVGDIDSTGASDGDVIVADGAGGASWGGTIYGGTF